jgi:hypothetical protein
MHNVRKVTIMASNDVSFNTMLKVVQEKRGMLYEARSRVAELEREVTKMEAELQSVCSHDFIAEDDGDYHRPGYYYTCAHCNYFTRFRPEKYRFR